MPEVLCVSSMADAEPDLSTFENKTGLAEDMKFLASMPELCDVTFLVGDTREPVCAVKVGSEQFRENRIGAIFCSVAIRQERHNWISCLDFVSSFLTDTATATTTKKHQICYQCSLMRIASNKPFLNVF